MAWFYNQIATHPGVDPSLANDTHSGKLSEYEFFQSTDSKAITFYTFFTTGSNPPMFGPFATLAEAQAKAAQNKPQSAGEFTQNLTGGGNLFGLGDPFNLNITEWLIRIGEIALGIVLIAVGFAKLTGIDNKISTAAKVVTKV